MCTNVIELPHVLQKSDWDCGIACVEMVLRKCLGQDFDEELLRTLGKSLGFGTSVWTIDVVNILVHFNINCVYYTITCGVDPGYKSHQYYQTCFEDDELRVNQLFVDAQELGLNIIKGCVTMEEIFSRLDQGWIAIVLVDSTLLRCKMCEQKYWSISNDLPWANSLYLADHYKGHYIILCGYDLGKKVIFYRNPSCQETQCCANISSFESARHSYGTDDDIIFVDLRICDSRKTLKSSTN